MKKLLLLSVSLLLMTICLMAQNKHVKWSAKLEGHQIQITAQIEYGWHIYSQIQSEDAICKPVSFNIPSVGTVRMVEDGKLKKDTITTLGIIQNEYEGTVKFTRSIATTPLLQPFSIYVTFQVCTNEKCMPPETVPVLVQ